MMPRKFNFFKITACEYYTGTGNRELICDSGDERSPAGTVAPSRDTSYHNLQASPAKVTNYCITNIPDDTTVKENFVVRFLKSCGIHCGVEWGGRGNFR
jgi:hypothetical protein